jgi:Ca-activated chloride channel family protein
MPTGSARFELTDKSVDFLGFRLLRHLLGSLGRSSFGRHETTHFATGVEAYQATKEYEFGDTLNLDISSTLMHAVAREGLGAP